jgi:hypothetical protein
VIIESKLHPRAAIVTALEKQIEEFFATGHSIQQIQSGVSGQLSTDIVPTRQYQLKSERTKLALALRREANAGRTLESAAHTLKINTARAQRIASEYAIEFNECAPPQSPSSKAIMR